MLIYCQQKVLPSLTNVVCDSNEAKFLKEKLVMDAEVLIWIILKCLSLPIFRTYFNNTYRRNWSFRSLTKKRLLEAGSLHYSNIWSKYKGPGKSHLLITIKEILAFGGRLPQSIIEPQNIWCCLLFLQLRKRFLGYMCLLWQ